MDNIKSRVVVVYFILLALLSWTSLLLQDNESKGALTVLNIILFVTPLMSLLYTVTYLYDSHDFQVLLLSQPIRRKQIWQSLYTGSLIKFAHRLSDRIWYSDAFIYGLDYRTHPYSDGMCQHFDIRFHSIPDHNAHERQDERYRCGYSNMAIAHHDL